MSDSVFNYPTPLGGSHGPDRKSVASPSRRPAPPRGLTYAGNDPAFAAALAQILAFHESFLTGASIEDAGIRAGEIIGYRAWLWDEQRLHSMFFTSHIWTPGSVEHIPQLGLTRGLHAYKNAADPLKQYGSYPGYVVFGEVSLWGEVIEHERGYRAEFAAIERLTEVRFFGEPAQCLARVQKTYGVA